MIFVTNNLVQAFQAGMERLFEPFQNDCCCCKTGRINLYYSLKKYHYFGRRVATAQRAADEKQ